VRKKQQLDPAFLPQTVSYSGGEKPGTLVIDTGKRFLYLVEGNGQARRYGIGVGKQGFGWKGTQRVSRKARMADLDTTKGNDRPRAQEGTYSACSDEGRDQQSSWRTRTLSRLHPLSYPRYKSAMDDWESHVFRLLPYA
jgi:lipoprotein-anchoring transpeptidase ErfK/SrfK